MTVTLWGRESSANVQKVRWALAELGVAYEHIPLGGKYGGNRAPEYLAMNPNGLVPTLRDGDLVLWESHAIVRYLAATYGQGTLWPKSPTVRATVDQWTDWTATTFQPAWIALFWNLVRTPEAERDAGLIGRNLADTERCFAIMEGQLAGTAFLGGDRLTYADIVAGAALFRWSTMPIQRQIHLNVGRWHEELRKRQAYRDAIEIDYAELVGRLAF